MLANPFPGLRPFSIDESHLFFGREGQSDEVLLKLSKNRFIGVIGPSGSGKSSFVYCGVLPILYGGFLTEASPNWDVVVTRPGSGPVENMAQAILEKDPNYQAADKEEQKIKRTITTTLLRSSSLGLVEAIVQTRKTTKNNYLILVDQFEELFRFKDSTENDNSLNETLSFVNMLMEAVNYTDAPIYVAITMRSDFIGDCAQFPDLTKKINDSHYLIPQLTRDQKRKAITGPTSVGGGVVAQRLVQTLLNDLGDSPDQLPILQHSLMRTWDYWSKHRERDEPMDLKHYDAIGRMEEALSMHANEAYDELDDKQKEICEAIFRAITEKRGENFGIRRPTRLSEIAAISEVKEEEVIAVVDIFRKPGRSLLTPPYGTPIEGRSMIDISHESLMRIWVRLKNWVDDEAEAVQMYLRLSEAASMYQVGKAGLWRPPDLQLALNWQQKHKPTLVWGQRYHPAYERTMVFLEYSKKEFETEQRIKELQAKRALKRARMTALIMGGATVVSIMFLLFAFAQKVKADQEAERARIAEADAVAQTVIAQEQKTLADEQRDLATAASILADERRVVAEDATALAEVRRQQADSARADAVASQEFAELQQAAAEAAKERADAEAERARLAEADALAQKLQAEKLRYIAIAKAMAIKATQKVPDQDLKGLLAQQAFIFNSTYEGEKFDPDIYDGLYFANKVLGDEATKSLEGHEKQIRGLISAIEGDHIYSGGTVGKILRWDVKEGERVADTLAFTSDNHNIMTLAASPDSKWLAAGGQFSLIANSPTYIQLFDLTTAVGTEPQRIDGWVGEVWDLDWTSDNQALIGLDNGGRTIRSYDFNTVSVIIESAVKLNHIAVSPDHKWIAGATADGKVIMWDRENNYAAKEFHTNDDPRDQITSLAYDHDGKWFAAGDQEGRVFLWDMTQIDLYGVEQDFPPEQTLTAHSTTIKDLEFSYDGQFMGSASLDASVRLWNLEEINNPPIVLSDHDNWVHSIAFSPDNLQLLAGTQDKEIRAWPTRIEAMSDNICKYVTRNFSKDEWDIFVGDDLSYEKTCAEFPLGEGVTEADLIEDDN